jgi:hypothetical protein
LGLSDAFLIPDQQSGLSVELHGMLDAIQKLINQGKATLDRKTKMLSWAKTLQNKHYEFVKRVNDVEYRP